MNTDRSNIVFAIVIGWALFLVLVCYQLTTAQESATWFNVDCLEWVDDDTYRIHFGYQSSEPETFTVAFQAPPFATAYISAPPDFVTTAGEYKREWYLEAESSDIVHTFSVTFSNSYSSHEMHLSNWTAELCEWVQVDPAPPVYPLPELRWAWDSGRGELYAYAPAGAIVPLPPAAGE